MSDEVKTKRKLADLTKWLKTKWSAVPVLGHLVYCSRKNHADTLKEFAVTVVFGTATFWVTALFLLPFTENRNVGYPTLVLSTMNAGQLFIFAVGMLGPILFIALDEPPNAKKFPGRTSHVVFLSLIALIAAGFYAIQLFAKNQKPDSQAMVDTDFLFCASAIIALLVLLVRYLTTVYRKSTLSFDPETQMKDPVTDFASEFANRHRGQE